MQRDKNLTRMNDVVRGNSELVVVVTTMIKNLWITELSPTSNYYYMVIKLKRRNKNV